MNQKNLNQNMPINNSSIILEPKLAARSQRKDDPLEVSLHTLPKPLLREFRHVFAENYLSLPSSSSENRATMMMDEEDNDATTNNNNNQLELLAIPTNQQARQDLVAVGDEIEKEKDRLLNVVSSKSFLTM